MKFMNVRMNPAKSTAVNISSNKGVKEHFVIVIILCHGRQLQPLSISAFLLYYPLVPLMRVDARLPVSCIPM